MADSPTRRLAGFIAGALMGFLYGLVSQFGNLLLLQDVPQYQPPPGPLATLLLTALSGGVLGLIAAWPEEALPGVLLSAGAATFASSLMAARESGWDIPFMMFLFLYIFLPRVVVFLPLAMLIRWTAGASGESMRVLGRIWVNDRLFKPLVLLVLTLAAGGFSIYPKEARQAVRDMDQLVRAGLKAKGTGQLPAALQPVIRFPQAAQSSYSLEWSSSIDRLPAALPEHIGPGVDSLVIAHFDNGYQFGCVFIGSASTPICRDFR